MPNFYVGTIFIQAFRSRLLVNWLSTIQLMNQSCQTEKVETSSLSLEVFGLNRTKPELFTFLR